MVSDTHLLVLLPALEKRDVEDVEVGDVLVPLKLLADPNANVVDRDGDVVDLDDVDGLSGLASLGLVVSEVEPDRQTEGAMGEGRRRAG